MYSELKEKMQKAAKVEADNRFDKVHSAASHAWHVATFMDGATAMYACLAPLVEWVSVEERLPEVGKTVLVKDWGGYYFIAHISVHGWINNERGEYVREDRKITYWRKMEL